MRVIVWGTYDTTKPRTRILLDALKRGGHDVTEIHAPIWTDVADKSQVTGFARRLAFLWRWLSAYPGLARRLASEPKADVLVALYLGQIDVLVLRLLSLMLSAHSRTPIVWDAFISLYDTIVDDRQLVASTSLIARGLRALESWSCRAATIVLLDTNSHAEYFARTFGFSDQKKAHVFVGAERAAFARAPTIAASPRPALAASTTMFPPTRVLFYGQFIPLHGIRTIVEAARLSSPADVQWVIIGTGQEAPRIDAMLAEQPLPHVTRVTWVNYEDLQRELARADVCLGIFGASGKASRVIPNKVFQIVSMGRPLVTLDSPGIRELFAPDEPGVYLVKAADPHALLAAVMRARDDVVHQRLPAALYLEALPRFSPEQIAQELTSVLVRATEIRSLRGI